MSEHKYLQFAVPPPNRRIVREIAVALLNRFFKTDLSRNKWEKQPPHTLPCWEQSGEGAQRREWTSKPITLKALERHLEGGAFDLSDGHNYFLDGKSVRPELVEGRLRLRAPVGSPTLRSNGLGLVTIRKAFDPKEFDLFSPNCLWLDPAISFGTTAPFGLRVTTTFGPNFPLEPHVPREGRAFNSFQLLLQNKILKLSAPARKCRRVPEMQREWR